MIDHFPRRLPGLVNSIILTRGIPDSQQWSYRTMKPLNASYGKARDRIVNAEYLIKVKSPDYTTHSRVNYTSLTRINVLGESPKEVYSLIVSPSSDFFAFQVCQLPNQLARLFSAAFLSVSS